ncbi:glutamine-synthetase adenylyltransferase [Jannaschia sp. W003]|uniref:[protein-PII] uridylyltransferase family protein n=1 Tax=Jannaschia sp. W003 TaxID=2867012 RepID=UPI0021A8E656|nr:glutamine-synthetase adenylyltransferase [Jannaschia sp. W003]UWQ20598.1 glutamine-synthetase adenylyltransferase [Jannaschia sp. W003]
MRPTRAPIPFDPDAGARGVAVCAPPDDWAEVVRGAAGSAPYLAGLIEREAAWLEGAWDADPGATLDAILAEAATDDDVGPALRRAKRRAALLVALCDLGGVWTTMQATAALTRLADAALDRALAHACARQKGLPEDHGLVAFAMGKGGAFELNYSSDIDVILLFDQSRHDPSDYATVRAALLKAARRAVALMQDVTADGYVFRTDLRLRPDPASTPIVMAMEAAERYYEGFGRAWERAAWIKARPCAGDLRAGEAFLETLRPFVWRRHLDFAAVEDAHAMRLGIRAHKEIRQDWAVPGHDLKLGQGGIREIEFFTQTRQIIAGGRDPSLRVRGTLEGLERLAAAGWVPDDHAERLAAAYGRLRDAEHRIQMVNDQQTHRMPNDAEGLRRIACLAGEDVEPFVANLRETLRGVERIVDPFFAPSEPREAEAIPEAEAFEERWLTYPALRSERARGHFARLRPALMAGFARAAKPAEALQAFDGFLRGLPAGVQLFALFEANPQLVSLIADICATAPSMARYLSDHAEVMDAVLDGSFFAGLGAFEAPRAEGDFETRLDTLRRWQAETHFRIGVHLLRRLVSPDDAGAAYARLAEATLNAAWEAAEAETARRYGRVPGQRLAAMGMGSLGAGRLTAASDLDLVVLHDGGEGPSDGRRALEPGQWAARFTQVLITALSAQMGAGRLYEVDMRLRPSGRQGPVAVPLSGFRSYQASEAWAWEHLALTRARPVAGDPALREAAEAARCEAIEGSRFAPGEVLDQTAAMLERLKTARPGGGLDVRGGAGGMQRIELAAQAHALLARCFERTADAQLAVEGWLLPDERAALREAHRLQWDVLSVMRLVGAREAPPGRGAADLLADTVGMRGAEAVAEACDVAAGRAEDAIRRALARGAG